MIEIPGRLYPDHTEEKAVSKTKRMEYHTERMVTLKCDRSIFVAIILAGTFFVLATYLSH